MRNLLKTIVTKLFERLSLKADEKPKSHRISRKAIAIVALILIVLVLVEIYAHTYVQIHNLPILTEAEALRLVPSYYNNTYTFSADGASWLVALQYKKPTPSLNYAYLFIFKTGMNTSFPVQNIDLLVLGLNPTSNGTDGYFHGSMGFIDYENNCTVVVVQYYIGQIGTYQFDFGLKVRVYEQTLLGFLPKDEIQVPVNSTVYYGP